MNCVTGMRILLLSSSSRSCTPSVFQDSVYSLSSQRSLLRADSCVQLQVFFVQSVLPEAEDNMFGFRCLFIRATRS